MPGNLVPAQMYDHLLVIVKSPDRLWLVDHHAAPAAGQSYNGGSLLSLDSNAEFTVGLPVGQTGVRPMPVFAIQGTDNYSANSDVNNLSGGVNSGLVATGLFEIETTEYVSQTYKPNDLLTGATGAALGKVIKAGVSPYGDVPMCGVVSKGVNTNHDGKSVLRFWTVYLPAGVNASSSSSSVSSSSLSSSLSSSSNSSSSNSSSSNSLSSSSLSSSSASL